MVVKTSLAHGLQTCVGNLWKEDDFSDFTVVVEDTSFQCHRFILSACSCFFQGLFRSQMKECIEAHAKLNGMTKGTFDIILNSVYKGIDGLSEDNVLDVWSATELLQIDYLTEECKKFVMCNISVANCLKFLNHATTYSSQNVIDHCLNFIIDHFQQCLGHVLELKFDYFYKVIASDFLVTDCEDTVMDAILQWVDCPLCFTNYSQMIAGALDNDTQNKILPAADISTESLSISGRTDKENDDNKKENQCQETENNQSATLFVIRNDEDTVNVKSNTVMSVDDKTVCNQDNNHRASFKDCRRNRRKHLFALISACRYLLLKSSCLEYIKTEFRHLLSDTGAYDFVRDALMYTLHEGRRHDSWPEAAVHRTPSFNIHVMVFLSNDKFMAYSLNSGSVCEFAELPENVHDDSVVSINVFDDILCLIYEDTGNVISFSMFKENEWACMGETVLCSGNNYVMLAHGIYMYCLREGNDPNDSDRSWCFCIHGHNDKWADMWNKTIIGNCLIRFHQYIVAFSTKNNVVTVLRYNTKTQKLHKCTTSMDGTSKDMVSFRHGDDVYILQRNGFLWKVFSTDANPVDFEPFSKLWDFDCSLKGCVLYRKKLFIFCDEMQPVDPSTLLTSLPGICENIEIIQINSRTQCLPMVLHERWLTSGQFM